MNTNRLYTIGFTKISAEAFFAKLKKADVKKMIDIRLKNDTQLAGFAKKENFKYFLKEIVGCEYMHMPEMAPTKQILDDYKNKVIGWDDYEREFNKLISDRNIQRNITMNDLNSACLLCAEPDPHKCHRRLVAQYLLGHFSDLEIIHL